MIKQINIHEAKTHFSQLLAEVQSGTEITIAKAGTPIARLVPANKKPTVRKPGSAKGRVEINPNFSAPSFLARPAAGKSLSKPVLHP